MVNWVTYLHDEVKHNLKESEPEESVPGGVDGTQNSSNANKLGTGCFGTFDKCVLANIAVRRGWKKQTQGSPNAMGVYDFHEIQAATQNISNANKLGAGGFGTVYKGVLSDGTSIAVKQLSKKSKQGIREFVNEVSIISAPNHPHLVKLKGCFAEHNQLLLVYEYMENNSLDHALFGSKELRLRLNWRTRVKICLGIAKGLAFLHEDSHLKIVHTDIKPKKILLDRDLNAKISDFGFAKLYDGGKARVTTQVAGTTMYMAPEYAAHGHLTTKADVFSFGVLTLQIVSGKEIVISTPDGQSAYLIDLAYVLQKEENLVELVDTTLELDSNSRKQAMAILDLAMMCINPSHALRPNMSQVVKILEGKSKISLSQSAQSGSTSQEGASDTTQSQSVGKEIVESIVSPNYTTETIRIQTLRPCFIFVLAVTFFASSSFMCVVLIVCKVMDE